MFHMSVLFCLFWWRLIGVFGNETNEKQSVSVTAGESVTLNSDLTEMRNDDIVWKFRDEKSLIKKQIFPTSDVPDGRFRDRLKLDDQTGSLTITNISTEHAGVYQLEISGERLTSKTFNVSVYARLPVPDISRDCSSSSSSSSSSSNCSLVCSSVVNVSLVTLSWYKGNSLLSSISASDLSISLSLPLEVEYQDNNTYSCVLNNPISNQTRHPNITQLCHTCAGPPVSVSLIVLTSVAAAGALLTVAAVVMGCICRRHRKTDHDAQTHEKEITYADPTFLKGKAHKSNVKELEHVVYAPIAMR